MNSTRTQPPLSNRRIRERGTRRVRRGTFAAFVLLSIVAIGILAGWLYFKPAYNKMIRVMMAVQRLQ